MDSNKFLGVKGMHLTHLNIRSLPAHLDLFAFYLKDSNISCATLSETWLTDLVPSTLMNIDGYTLTRLDRKTRAHNNQTKKGGGVAAYIHNSFDFSDSELAHLNLSNNNSEIQWLTISKPYIKKLIIANVYRPPKGSIINFLDHINHCYAQLQKSPHNEIFILGDLNIDLAIPNDPNSKALKQLIKQIGCKQLINEPTHFNKQSKDSLLDLIITNSEKIIEVGTKDLNISDHELIYISRCHTSKPKEKLNFIGRSYRNYDKAAFIQKLKNSNWDHLWTFTDPESAWDFFVDKLNSLLSHTCPVKEFKINKRKEPWLNRQLLEILIDKDRSLRRAKRTNNEDDWNIARYFRNQAKLLVRQAKAEYYKEQLDMNKKNPKKFWHTVANILNTNKKPRPTINLTDQNSGNKVPESETANYINQYFANIGPNLAANLTETWTYEGITKPASFTLTDFTEQEVLKVLNNIETSKSSGIKDISTSVLKDALTTLPYHMTFILNLSIRTNLFPASWKKANIIPLPKDGDPCDVNNYRPISLLPLPGKILERLVHAQTISYLESNNILCPKTRWLQS